MKKSQALFASFAVIASLGIAACGDSGGDKLSKSELASKGTAICKAATKEGSKIKAPTNIADPGAAADYFTKLVELTEKQTGQLEDLEPADDIKDDWNAFIDKQKEANDLLRETRDAAKEKDPSGLTKFQAEGPKVGQAVDAAGKKIGLNC